MRAIVKTVWEPEAIEIKEVDKPSISADEVLIKVHASGICGTDLEIYKATSPIPIQLPRILGHEFSGVVAEVGEKVTNVKVGDRVVSESGVVCRHCIFCRMGRHNLCPERRPIGIARDGAFAEYVKAPSINIHKVPDNVSLDEAALTEPLSVAVHAVIERSQVMAGDAVAVVGAGTIGLLVLGCASLAGARMVLISGRHKNRLEVAKRLNADVVVNEKEENPVERVMELTDGLGVDVAYEATGNPRAVEQAIAMTRKGGKVVLIGVHSRPLESFNLHSVISNEKTILGCWTHTSSTWDRALHLLSSKKINVAPLITHQLPLEQIRLGFDLLKKRKAIKVLMKPGLSEA